MMQSANPVPDYLHDIYTILKCAYPDGINDTDYWPVLSLLHNIMSFWTMAEVLSALTNKDRSEIYNDASGFGLDPVPTQPQIDKVKQKLDPCGFDVWFQTNKTPHD